MTLARTRSVALSGVEGHVIEVEADLAEGLPGLTLTGLPDTAVAESRDRIRAAVVNSGENWPLRRITLALLPATLPKHGSGFDLPLAVAILCAAGAAPAEPVADAVLIGELGLDGRVRPVRGVLAAVLAASRAGVARAIVPMANASEAALVPGLEVRGVGRLAELLAHLRGELVEMPIGQPALPDDDDPPPDLADVVGQAHGRRVLAVAAAGGHHAFFLGPPGAGKTMLAERLPGLLPVLDDDAALEVTAIHSVAGALPPGAPLIRRPPFQDPHHTATVPSLVGGGSGSPRPGAVSLAHHGILFMDEAPEFTVGTLDALRQPMERGDVLVARASGLARFPARFQLILAANPCPCARAGGGECTCSPTARRRYLSKLSGPLLDRIDLQVWLMAVSRADLLSDLPDAEPTAIVAKRVRDARAAAAERWTGMSWRTNSCADGSQLRTRWRLPGRVTRPAERAMERGLLSARGFDRVLRISWSIADLAGSATPTETDVAEAVGMRTRQVGLATGRTT